MLKITGHDDKSDEWKTALALRDKVLEEYPGLASDDSQQMYIFPSVQTPFCGDCKNVDIFILAKFDTPLFFTNADGELARCYSFSATMEVKSHSPPAVWFEGDQVWVQYNEGPSPATQQGYKQPFAIKKYYQRKGFDDPPFIDDFVWLSQCQAAQFDADVSGLPSGVIFADTSFSGILSQALSRRDGARDLRYLRKGFDFARATSVFCRLLVPSKFARDRVEALTESRYKRKAMRGLGREQLSLLGYGGAGKTALLLRTAKELYERGQRSLILTYHTALTSDLYRQLQVIGLRQTGFGKSVNVETLHSFFRRWLVDLQEVDARDIDDDWFDARYYEALKIANQKIRAGIITENELAEVKLENPASYSYSFVMIDEAQDWHDEERDFIYSVYGSEHLVLSIGRRQLIRSDHPCLWEAKDRAPSEPIDLKKCLRLKANLAAFVTSLAAALGDVSFVLESDAELPGGEVHIVIGSLASHIDFIEELLLRNDGENTKNVDHLFCVPPSQVDLIAGIKQSRLGAAFAARGYEIYDAVERDVRMGTPSSHDDIRIIQYDSSRGLEGWMVGLDLFDEYFDVKREQIAKELGNDKALSFLKEELADRRALEWILIPVTRGIDTLVISIESVKSTLGSILIDLAKAHSDFIRLH